MATPKDFPSKINLGATDVSGDILITGILKAGTVTIDGAAIAFTTPVGLDSPISCSTLNAPAGTVAYFKRTALWDPLSIKSELIAWYDFSDTSTIMDAAGVVSAVTDKAPTGFNAYKTLSYDLTGATSGGVKPTTDLYTVNGLNVMSFTSKSYLDSGSENVVVWDSAVSAEQGNLLVVFAAGLKTAFNTEGKTGMPSSSLVSMNKNAGSDWQLDSRHVMAGSQVYEGALNGTGTTVGPNGTHPNFGIWSAIFNKESGSTKSLFFNGTLIAAGATNKMANSQQLRINSSRPADAWPNSNHGEMIIGFDINMQEIAEGYLAHKWGVSGDLAASHPYKNSAPTA